MSKLIVPRRSLLLGSAALALAPASVFAASDLGKPAPAFSATDSNGKVWSLGELKGKIVVLETTNQDCPYVRKHYNSTNMQTQQREAAAKGVVWLTVASSAPGEQGHVTAAQANALTQKRNAAPAAFLLDPQSRIARAYGATVTPHMYIVDAAGTLVYKGGIADPVAERAAVGIEAPGADDDLLCDVTGEAGAEQQDGRAVLGRAFHRLPGRRGAAAQPVDLGGGPPPGMLAEHGELGGGRTVRPGGQPAIGQAFRPKLVDEISHVVIS